MNGPHVHLHRNGLRGDMLGFQKEHVAPRKGARRQKCQAVQRHVFEIVWHEVQKARVGPERSRMHAALRDKAHMQRARGVLVLLVRKEPFHKHIARLARCELLQLVDRRIALARQQTLGFDLQKRRGHQQKIARHIEIERVHARHLGQVLIGNLRNGDGADVHLLATDQVQQEVERPFEAVYANLVRHGRSYETRNGNSRLATEPAVASR